MARNPDYAQHFLKSPRLVAELIGHSNVRKNDLVYDLGAGSGIIASVLAGRCREVIAVEIEPEALKKLRFNTASNDNISVVEQDMLSLTPPDRPYKIFANIPFQISSEVVRKFTETPLAPKSMYLIVQKQFARKLVLGDDHFTSQLGAEIAPLFTARIRKPLQKTDFTPPPAVDTVLLEIKKRDEPLIPLGNLPSYREFIARCYGDQKFLNEVSGDTILSKHNKPSEISLEMWLTLFEKYSQKIAH